MTPTMAFVLAWMAVSTMVRTGNVTVQGPEEGLRQHWESFAHLPPADALAAVPVPVNVRNRADEVVVAATVCPRPLGRGFARQLDAYEDAFPAAVRAWPHVKACVGAALAMLPSALSKPIGAALSRVVELVEANHGRLATPQPAWLTHYSVGLRTDVGTVVVTDIGRGTAPRVVVTTQYNTAQCYEPHNFTSLSQRKTLRQVHTAVAGWFKRGATYTVASVFALAAGVESAHDVYSCQSYAMGLLAFVGADGILANTYGGTAGLADMIALLAMVVAVYAIALAWCVPRMVLTLARTKATPGARRKLWVTSVAIVATMYLGSVGVAAWSLPQYFGAGSPRVVASVLGYLGMLAMWPTFVSVAASPVAVVARLASQAGNAGCRRCGAWKSARFANARRLVCAGHTRRGRQLAATLCTPARIACGSMCNGAAQAVCCRRPRVGPRTRAEAVVNRLLRTCWWLGATSVALLATRCALGSRVGTPLCAIGVRAAWVLALASVALLCTMFAPTALAPLPLAVGLLVDGVAAAAAVLVAAWATVVWLVGVAWLVTLWCASIAVRLALVCACTVTVAAGFVVMAPFAVVVAH